MKQLGLRPVFLLLYFEFSLEEDADRKDEEGIGGDARALAEDGRRTPEFVAGFPSNVTYPFGKDAYLVCGIRNVGNRTVTWIRQRDAYIISADTTTFIYDNRFQVHRSPDWSNWTLHIRFVTKEDSGVYECQISSPSKLSRSITLNVRVPTVDILNKKDVIVVSGSTVSFQCQISGLREDTVHAFWYHQFQPVDSDRNPRIRVREERVTEDILVSVLEIARVRQEDGGNYTCRPPTPGAATVALHVIQAGDAAAAIHQSGVSNHAPRRGGRPDGDRQLLLRLLLLLPVASVASTTALCRLLPPSQFLLVGTIVLLRGCGGSSRSVATEPMRDWKNFLLRQ